MGNFKVSMKVYNGDQEVELESMEFPVSFELDEEQFQGVVEGYFVGVVKAMGIILEAEEGKPQIILPRSGLSL